ncbi:MAG: restriction endonuclease subunit S, partial [Chlorobium sp.]|nr:restriction endonuclease subunit S [Chlorobium sp.]
KTRRGQWQGKGKYKEPAASDMTGLPELPAGWVWASSEQLSASESYSLAIGPFGSNLKVSDYADIGVPLVFVRNIRAISFGGPDAVYISAEKAKELRPHRVDAGDILITKMGDPPGDVCIYPANRPPAVITADCIKLRLAREAVLSQFFAYAIESDSVHKQILNITKGVAQLKVSLGRFRSIGLPLPPFPEQHRIVTEVDRRLSLVREVEAQVEASLKRAERLRQSILQQAFTGRLIPSGPADEPAYRLLDGGQKGGMKKTTSKESVSP